MKKEHRDSNDILNFNVLFIFNMFDSCNPFGFAVTSIRSFEFLKQFVLQVDFGFFRQCFVNYFLAGWK